MKRALVLAVVLAACGGGGGGSGGDDTGGDDDDGGGSGNGSVFDKAVKDVVLEIDYETGQEPYTGAIVGFGDAFDVTKSNLDRVFSGTKTLTIPTTTAQMQDIGPFLDDEELTVDDVLAIADAHRDTESTSTKTAYYVVFVSGHFTDENGPNNQVLGVSIGNTHVLVMFKDVIRSTGSALIPNVEKYVEQSTLVHELGHAVGLVNNGVPMVAAHQDTAHGAHCTNDHCTMYWVNEGASSAAAFAQMYITSGDSIIFGDECLADVDALTSR